MAVKHLLIGSLEAYSGKSATILGLAQQLLSKDLQVAYGKPVSTLTAPSSPDGADEDIQFLKKTLGLATSQLRPTILWLDTPRLLQRMQGGDQIDYQQQLGQYGEGHEGDLVVLEGPSTLNEGQLFDLSLAQMAAVVDAEIVLIVRGHSPKLVDALVDAKRCLGDRLLGVLINDIPDAQFDTFTNQVKPFLEAQQIAVFGLMPRSSLLRSVSVQELVEQLQAEVLCGGDRLGLMVEQLTIGAMNVNSALKYFHKAINMAVVTGSDRTDLQLAALEASTQCLILTGRFAPNTIVLNRADDLEIPVLLVDSDTLTTVEIVDRAFGQVRLHEAVKVEYIEHLFKEHFDLDRLLTLLGLAPALSA
ncbi:phosphotransacetylase family protein [Acaryochloris thomasi]|uniref:phosphotransacetylase family protein n=1 Tax=Acaryochloris thomasi TaxID=2929456 RepID=UPI000DA6D0EF|nr:phosphotransacetylase family protein [Acaryochloris thomasi]